MGEVILSSRTFQGFELLSGESGIWMGLGLGNAGDGGVRMETRECLWERKLLPHSREKAG